MNRCLKCDKPIEVDRIKHFLSTTGQLPEECASCSSVERVMPVLVYDHKTAGHVELARTDEQKRQARRFLKRSR
jgi:hypothetical protein